MKVFMLMGKQTRELPPDDTELSWHTSQEDLDRLCYISPPPWEFYTSMQVSAWAKERINESIQQDSSPAAKLPDSAPYSVAKDR